jgi:DMSO/TMAO reductase YedYZ molybdopterin-dependent catalytic subunit
MEKTKIHKKLPYVTVAIVGIILVTLFIFGLPQTNNLYPTEVRNYEGQNLSSIAEVRENAIRGIQQINQTNYRLTIKGLVNTTLQLTYDEVVNNHQKYQKIVTLYCVDGWSAKILWEGILVKDLLKEAGFNSSAKVVIFYASDGYSTSLPLDYIVNNNILLAPFELVAESQYGYKWIKWVTQIEVSNNENYKGYWESRGFPINATLRP